MKLDLMFGEGYPHIGVESENECDRAFLTSWVLHLAKDKELLAFYWPIVRIETVARDPEETCLGQEALFIEEEDARDKKDDTCHAHGVTVSKVWFQSICPWTEGLDKKEELDMYNRTIEHCKKQIACLKQG